jgi:CMP-N,N'-diacetyllegionaminic acid synthase
MGVTAIIPARGGSKGLPGKNLARIGGRSLVGIAVTQAREVPAIDEIIVSSDAPEILEEGRRWGAHAVQRPHHLARDDSPTIDVVRELMSNEHSERVIVLLQPTSPLRRVEDIDECLCRLDDPGVDSVVTVTELPHPVEWNCTVDQQGWLRRGSRSGVSRRQDAPLPYVVNGAVYVSTAGHVLHHSFVGDRTKAVPMPRERSIDIDSPIDLLLARLIFGRGSKTTCCSSAQIVADEAGPAGAERGSSDDSLPSPRAKNLPA